MRHADSLLLRRLHREVFAQFEAHGTLATSPIRPALAPAQQLTAYGCMKCRKRRRTKAGEGVHMFRAHGQVAQERHWISGTSCEACLKEFHTLGKLQVHLRTAQRCREVLHSLPPKTQVLPGFGSKANEQLREQHDGLLPVQQAQGPCDWPHPATVTAITYLSLKHWPWTSLTLRSRTLRLCMKH